MELKVFIDNKEKLTSLIKESIESQISEFTGKDSDEDDDELDALSKKVLRDLQGKDESENSGIVSFGIDEDKLADESAYLTDLQVPLEQIISIFLDPENKIQGKEKMVVSTVGGIYDALYEKEKYEMYIEYVKMKDFITVNTMKLTYDALLLEFRRGIQMMKENEPIIGMKKSDSKESSDDKIIPMAKMDNNKN